MPIAEKQLVTAEQLAEMPDLGRCELVNGEVREMTPAGSTHGRIASTIDSLLRWHVKREGLGTTYTADPGFILARDPDTVRAPDVAFVSKGREPEDERGYFPGPPDLAVEVVSPTDSVKYVDDKVRSWLDAGTRAVWVVWPNTRTVTVYRPGAAALTLREEEDLDGGDVVPDFRCRVGEIFAK
ncbi:MAG TPA: Uma2 family endonuclease [Phycisphaerae bacterium]|nr:Uma2 family endonuclease [Phycisphaerae bacterium]